MVRGQRGGARARAQLARARERNAQQRRDDELHSNTSNTSNVDLLGRCNNSRAMNQFVLSFRESQPIELAGLHVHDKHYLLRVHSKHHIL